MTYSRSVADAAMAHLPPNHPDRLVLADEVHARPPESLELPCRATYVAVLVDADDRERERQHVAKLCSRFDVAPPAAGMPSRMRSDAMMTPAWHTASTVWSPSVGLPNFPSS